MPGMPTSLDSVLRKLKQKGSARNLAGMAHFGMSVDARLGVSVADIRQIDKGFGHDHQLALALWKTGFAEARIMASIIDEPEKVTQKQMEQWVKGLDSWDVCDQVCMNLFEKTPWAWEKVTEWAQRDEEFVKRAAFSLLACLAWHNKTASDDQFIAYFPVLKSGATDERNFVRKAVNWALRAIGKRNLALNRAAIKLAKEIQRLDSKAARWIAADALRELEGTAVKKRLK